MTLLAGKGAVLGKPIAHSLSPALHLAAYQALGLGDWSYAVIECGEDELPGIVGSCGPDWAGLSLTMPLKRAVLPLLDVTDSLAVATGGANTLIFRDGRKYGYNTDVPGIVTALTEAGVKSVGRVTILGGGATACSALAALADLGVTAADVVVRDPTRATGLLAAAGRLDMTVTLTDAPPSASDLLISTLPAGAADGYARRLLAGELTAGAVLEVVYADWPTPLARAAAETGATVVSGFEMLLHQAAGQVELMTGREAPVEVMRVAGERELASHMRNMA
jgi:shikimate dehydrogenase